MRVILTDSETRRIISILREIRDSEASKIAEQLEAKCKSDADAQWYRLTAALKSKEGELEVDDDAPVSQGDQTGAYVSCWIWVGKVTMKAFKKEAQKKHREEKSKQ